MQRKTAQSVAGHLDRCSICGTSADDFIDYNGPKRLCPVCKSTERQRVLAQLYALFIKPEFDLAGKAVLVAALGNAERHFLDKQGIRQLSTIDVRPELKADHQADLCNMPAIGDRSFDAIIASFVLTCVYDLHACLSEMNRVLRPGGRLFTCDPIQYGRATVEYSDIEYITHWYGREAYERYRVGHYRRFGDLELIEVLSQYFIVKTLYGLDVPTTASCVWHMSIKRH
jgi:SAM-dependent methyltransferase